MDISERREPSPPPTRTREHRVLAGVCGGLARRTDIDPIVYRVAFGTLGLVGVGVLLYAAAWTLLPRDDTDRTWVEQRLGRRIDGPAILVLLVALLIVPTLLAPASLGSPTLALIVILGVAALAAHRRGADLAGALRAVPGRLRFPPLPPTPPPGEHEGADPTAPFSSERYGHTGPWRAGPPPAQSGPAQPPPVQPWPAQPWPAHPPGGGPPAHPPPRQFPEADAPPGQWQRRDDTPDYEERPVPGPPHPAAWEHDSAGDQTTGDTLPYQWSGRGSGDDNVATPDTTRPDTAGHDTAGPDTAGPDTAGHDTAGHDTAYYGPPVHGAGAYGSVPRYESPPFAYDLATMRYASHYPPYAYSPAAFAPEQAERRRKGGARLTLLTTSAALVVAGALTAVSMSGAASVSPRVVLAAAIMTTGCGLVIGARYGRGRPLIGVGLVLSLLLVAVAAIGQPLGGVPLRGGIGDQTWRPLSTVGVGNVEPYRLAAGEGTLTLTDLPAGGSYEYTASVGFGELRVRVPASAEVVVHARADFGAIVVNGREIAAGQNVGATTRLEAPEARDAGSATSIELHLAVGLGEVRVNRVSP